MAKCSSLALVLLLTAGAPCEALTVSGVPDWLAGAVTRSLKAVWSEIPDSPGIDREATLEVVAGRLFAGYDVKVIPNRDRPVVIFLAQGKSRKPAVKIITPELRGMALAWFELDTAGMSDDVAAVVDGVPQSALTWADEALRERLGRIVSERLPGWEFTQQIYISPDDTLLTLSFRPSPQMVLAVKPSMYSRTIPAMFMSDLEAKLIPEFSPLIGLPVKWAAKHKSDIERAASESLEDRHTIDNLRANVSVKFHPGTVSELDAQAESSNFMFQVWVAAYAGLEGRYPEAGTFFAYRPDGEFMPEVYAELIFSLDDFSITRRLGGRFEVAGNFWGGVEVQWPDNKYFLRFQYDPLKVRRPYALWRWSPEIHAHEAALGYRVDEHVSVEIYYYNSGEEKLGLRGMWHL